MSYIAPAVQAKFETLSIDLKNEILERNVQINTIYDLIHVLEEIVSEGSWKLSKNSRKSLIRFCGCFCAERNIYLQDLIEVLPVEQVLLPLLLEQEPLEHLEPVEQEPFRQLEPVRQPEPEKQLDPVKQLPVRQLDWEQFPDEAVAPFVPVPLLQPNSFKRLSIFPVCPLQFVR